MREKVVTKVAKNGCSNIISSILNNNQMHIISIVNSIFGKSTNDNSPSSN